MAARRRKLANGGGNGHAFAVVVEEMRGHFKAYGEALEGVRQNVDGLRQEMHARFEQVDRRLDRIEGRLDGVEGRLGGVEGRLGGVEGRLDGVEGEVDRVKTVLLDHTRELKALRIAVDKKVDREESGS